MKRLISFKRISVTNFLSIGNEPVVVDFQQGLHFITGINKDKEDRANGTGKSTIIDALYFVITGSAIREIKNDHIRNNVTKGTTNVSLKFTVTENAKVDEYELVRTIPSKCFLYKNGVDVTRDSIASTTEEVFSLLDCTKVSLQNFLSMTSSNMVPFFAKTKAEKRSFVEGLLNLSFISEIGNTVKSEIKGLEKEDIQLTSKLETMDTQLNELKIRISDQKNMYDKSKADLDKQKNDLELSIRINEQKLSEVGDIEAKQQEYNTLQEQHKQCEEQLQKSAAAYNEYDRISSVLDSKLQGAKKQLADSVAFNEKSQADAKLNKDKIALSIQEQTAKLVEQQQVLISLKEKTANTSLEQLRKNNAVLVNEKGDLVQKINDINTQVAVKRAEYTKIKQQIADIESGNMEIPCPKCKRAFSSSDIEHIQAHKAELSNGLATLESEAQTLNNAKQQLQKQVEVYEQNIKQSDADISSTAANINTMSIVEEKIKNLNSTIQQLTQQNEVKPQILELEPIEKLIVTIQNKAAQIRQEKEAAQPAYDQLQIQTKKTKETLDRVNNELQSQINNKNTLISTIAQDKKMAGFVVSQLEQLDSRFKSEEINIESKQKDIDAIRTKLNALRGDLVVKNYAKFIFSDDGLKPFLIRRYIKIINTEIQKYLTLLGSNSRCVFDESFEETIIGENGKECTYWNFSGAERRAIDIACMFAFLSIIRLQGQAQYDLIFFDEVIDGTLDARGVEQTFELIKKETADHDLATYIISHRKELFGQAESVIIVQKENHITTRIQ